LLGAISSKEFKKIPKEMWNTVTVGKIAVPFISHVTFDEYLFTVVQKLNSEHFDLIPVLSTDQNKVIGIIRSQMLLDILAQENK